MPPTYQDLALVAASLVAVSLLTVAGRWVVRREHGSVTATRKALHAAVGAWTLWVTPQFHSVAWALVPPLLFIAVNVSPWTKALVGPFSEAPAQARGLWSYPLGVSLVYLLFWEAGDRPAILAGVAALAFADPIAAVVGSSLGQRRFRGPGRGRSLEGSLAFFLVAAVGVGIVASTHGGGAYPWRMGVGCGLAGALGEALTPSGWDNVSIPLVVAAAYRALA